MGEGGGGGGGGGEKWREEEGGCGEPLFLRHANRLWTQLAA